jgi:hypothetical protein
VRDEKRGGEEAGRKPRERARADDVRRERERERRGHSGSEITLACSYSYELIPPRACPFACIKIRDAEQRERERDMVFTPLTVL